MRRKKEAQSPGAKRHGAAWGAGSPTFKRTASARQKQAAADEGHSGDFGRYMANKVRKLGEQFQVDASNSSGDAGKATEGSGIFAGISIHVNGHTTPSHQELRTLMLNHGGNFENYFSKARVTHIICSNLPYSKITEFRSFSKGLPVLKPEWVVNCVAAGKLLPWSKYQLEIHTSSQRTLSSFFGVPKLHCTGEEESLLNGEMVDKTESSHKSQDGSQVSIPVVNEPQVLAPVVREAELPTSGAEDLDGPLEWKEDGDWDETENQNPHSEENTDGRSEYQDKDRNFLTKHSTLGDGNFVQNYFKSSRLHFIGTWRNRYQGTRNLKQEISVSNTECSQRAIIHVDMDCFFVSVVTRHRPELTGKPVAVCHSGSSKGTAEISSANYVARGFGVKAGMFVRNARACCPNLEIVPYDFEGYEQVAEKLYEILHRYSSLVQAVSCDEAFLDVTGLGDPAEIALAIRQELFEYTQCTASAGISTNILLSRLATKKAKPNGQYHIHLKQAGDFMAALPVGDLPGVGSALKEKLHSLQFFTCSDICCSSKDALRKLFGQKTGEMLWNYAHGIDDRKLQPAQERKSIGAEVNWGVRFTTPSDAQHFLVTLSEEVSTRLAKAAVHGRTFTMKVRKRKAGAGEPVKFMGCGICDNISRSVTLPSGTRERDVILRVSRQLFGALNIDVCEIRGLGLQVSKLEPFNDLSGSLQGQNRLESWITKSHSKQDISHQSGDGKKDVPRVTSGLPPTSEIDPSVLASLPPELFVELNEAYNGALSEVKLPRVHENKESSNKGNHTEARTGDGESSLKQERNFENASRSFNIPTMSQLDKSVLEELPTPLRKEIMDCMPASKDSTNQRSSADSEKLNLWADSPPIWVKYFQDSGSPTWQAVSELYMLARSPKHLSEVLMSLNALPRTWSSESMDSIIKCSELISHYLRTTVSTDLEELSAVIRLIRRMARKSEFWCEVQNRVLPVAQDQVLRTYDGHLRL